jgi:hypothetical protein
VGRDWLAGGEEQLALGVFNSPSALADDTFKFHQVAHWVSVQSSSAIPLFYDNLALSDGSVLRFKGTGSGVVTGNRTEIKGTFIVLDGTGQLFTLISSAAAAIVAGRPVQL